MATSISDIPGVITPNINYKLHQKWTSFLINSISEWIFNFCLILQIKFDTGINSLENNLF